ncbi:GrpE protein-like [Quillaja saponaria]|uniref:GrpE protein-like n=1 Tax=Quillaja saponaria TaxID=32244 RepID=A0AAD7LMF3_QUISA|nr:GrpE protein-like [Quillaja saponaria]
MFVTRVLSRVTRSVCRSSMLISASQRPQHSPTLSNQFHSLVQESPAKLVPCPMNLLHHSPSYSSFFPGFAFSSSATPEPSEKEQRNNENNGKAGEEAKVPDQNEEYSGKSKAADQTKESDSGSEDDLSRDDLVKLVVEKEELLKLKQKEMEKMQDKVLRSYAEMENVMGRTRREAENSKKFAIQVFVQHFYLSASVLLSKFCKKFIRCCRQFGKSFFRLSKRVFSKIDASKDSAGAVPLLKTLLEGVEMTEKQLAEVFKKFGVEKFDPTNEPFDPHRHNAVFQIPDGTKSPGTIAHVLKPGYVLFDRVIRPAEVGVTQAVEDNDAANGSAGD